MLGVPAAEAMMRQGEDKMLRVLVRGDRLKLGPVSESHVQQTAPHRGEEFL